VRRAKLSGTQKTGPVTRDRIVAVAEELIARSGVEGMQVKEIAARVGIRPPSVFAHFNGKDDIVSAVVERMLRRMEALFDAPAKGTPEEEVRARTSRLVLFLIDNPAYARIVLREWAQAGAPDVERYDLRARLLDRIYGRVTKLLQRGADAGRFRRMRAESFVAQLLGGILAQLAWMGWDVSGHPRPLVSRAQLVRDAKHLAVALLQSRVEAGAKRSARHRTGPKPQKASGRPRRSVDARGRHRSESPR
jgi:AcrR family transcriptional regulator